MAPVEADLAPPTAPGPGSECQNTVEVSRKCSRLGRRIGVFVFTGLCLAVSVLVAVHTGFGSLPFELRSIRIAELAKQDSRPDRQHAADEDNAAVRKRHGHATAVTEKKQQSGQTADEDNAAVRKRPGHATAVTEKKQQSGQTEDEDNAVVRTSHGHATAVTKKKQQSGQSADEDNAAVKNNHGHATAVTEEKQQSGQTADEDNSAVTNNHGHATAATEKKQQSGQTAVPPSANMPHHSSLAPPASRVEKAFWPFGSAPAGLLAKGNSSRVEKRQGNRTTVPPSSSSPHRSPPAVPAKSEESGRPPQHDTRSAHNQSSTKAPSKPAGHERRRRRDHFAPFVAPSNPVLQGHPRWHNNRSKQARPPQPTGDRRRRSKDHAKSDPKAEEKEHSKDHPKDNPKGGSKGGSKDSKKDDEDEEDEEEDDDEDDFEEGFIAKPTGVIIPPKDLVLKLSLPSGCRRALKGTCYNAVLWAKNHPAEHKGLSACSDFDEFQERLSWQTGPARHECGVPCQAMPLPASLSQCHIPVAREWCYEVVQWALLHGIKGHPDWYPGLNQQSTFEDFQRLFNRGGWGSKSNGPPHYANCGPPCEVPEPDANRAMRSTPGGVCLYELPTKFNLELRDSTFRQREPKARPLKLPEYHLWGLHDQNQFALERVFYDRMQAEANTLRWPSACKAFYVPYFTEWETGDVKGIWKVADRPWLENELIRHLVHFGNHRRRRCNSATPGSDHFVVMGRISRDGVHFLNNGRFSNMVKLAIEDTHPGRWQNVFAVPYPSWFRYNLALEQPGGPSYIQLLELHCKSLWDIASRACYMKETCVIDTRLANCDGRQEIYGKYKCGNTVRDIWTDLKDPLRTRLVLSCRIGPCWLSGSCDEACKLNLGVSGKGLKVEPWQTFWRSDAANGGFFLKTHHGKYLQATPDGHVQGSGSGAGWWETFWQEPQDNGQVSIKTWHGSHLSVNEAGDVSAIQEKNVGGWEKFKVMKTAQGSLAFQTWHGKFLTAEKECTQVWVMPSPEVVIIGSAKTGEKVRQRIIEQCDQRKEHCLYVGTGARDKSSGDLKDKVGRFAEILTTSLFCINPPGDTPTRKGIFDSLILGCIPVITDSRSLEHYRWHLPEWRNVCVYLQEDVRDKKFNIVDYLMNMKEKDRGGMMWRLMQIQKLAFSLQYSMEPTHEGWRGPDAFDVALQKVVEFQR